MPHLQRPFIAQTKVATNQSLTKEMNNQERGIFPLLRKALDKHIKVYHYTKYGIYVLRSLFINGFECILI